MATQAKRSVRSLFSSISRVFRPDHKAASMGRLSDSTGAIYAGPMSSASASACKLRAGSRYAVANFPLVNSAVSFVTDSVVGVDGLKPVPVDLEKAAANAVKRAWGEWTEEYCDAERRTDLAGIATHVKRAELVDGEAFIRIRRRRDGSIQLQAIEADYIPFGLTQTLGKNKIVDGIEFNSINQPVAYHVYKSHPADHVLALDSGSYVRVPARDMIHVFAPERPGQHRGIPAIQRAMPWANGLDEYLNAELVRKRNTSAITHFITKPDEGTDLDAPEIRADEYEDENEPEGTPVGLIEAGSTVELQPGEDWKGTNPAESGNSFGPFMKAMEEQLSQAICGLPRFILTSDYGSVNLSAARAALFLFDKQVSRHRQFLVHQFYRRVWAEWLKSTLLTGRLEMEIAEAATISRMEWQPTAAPLYSHIDVLKDVKATDAEISLGVKSRSAAIRERGKDPEAVFAEIAEEQARLQELGVNLADAKLSDVETDANEEDADVSGRTTGAPMQHTSGHVIQ